MNMKSVADFITEDLTGKGAKSPSDVYVADFEMITVSKHPEDDPDESIVSGAVIGYINNKEEEYSIKQDQYYTNWQIKETCKLLGVSKESLLSGISFKEFYAKLKNFVGNGVLVVWGDYDNKVLEAQCERHNIKHTIKVVDIQDSIAKYFNSHGAIKFQYHENGMKLPLRKVYPALTGSEADTTHNPLTDAKQLRKVLEVILTNANGVEYFAINTILLQTLYLFNQERIALYMTHQIKMNVSKLVGHEAGLKPEFIYKGKIYENKFLTYQQLLLQVADESKKAELQYWMDDYEEYEENIDLSEFGPVDEDGDPVGW